MAHHVLVTGGAGFIGSHLSRRLIARGYHVTIVDNLSSGTEENIPPQAEFLRMDLAAADDLRAVPDRPYVAICHLAGQSSGERSFDDPLYDLNANARSTLALARWALARRVPVFLHASSMAVYGQPGMPVVSESMTPAPLSFYGASKYSAELLLRVAARQGLRVCSLRMFSVYGPGQNLAEMKQGMVSIYLAFLLKQEPVTVRGSLDRVRDFVYVDDVVTAWELALERPVSGALNIGSGCGTSVRALIGALIAACGCDHGYPVKEEAGTPGDQYSVYADITRIREQLGWAPRVGLAAGLERMVAWARSCQGAVA